MEKHSDFTARPTFSRRRFLLGGAATLTLAAGGCWLLGPAKDAFADVALRGKREMLLVCNTNGHFDESAKIVVTPSSELRAFDVASRKAFAVNLPFFGHTAIQNPKHPQRVYVFEKWGKRGAQIDLGTRNILNMLTSDQDNVFFGHGAFIRDASILVTSEDTYTHEGGQLVLRDPQTLKAIGNIPTHGVKPHECVALENGKVLLVANGGRQFFWYGHQRANFAPNIAWIEASSGRLLQAVPVNFNVGHLALSHDGWILAGGMATPRFPASSTSPNAPDHFARAALLSPEGKLITLTISDEHGDDLPGETLSATFIGKTGLVAYTLPASNRVYFWRYRTQQLAGWINLPRPDGIVADLAATDARPSVFVSERDASHLAKVILPKGSSTPVSESVNDRFSGNGSHMVRLYV